MRSSRPSTYEPGEPVRLVYHYEDGHEFITETMLRAEAIAYMPVLCARPVDADHFEARFGVIEFRAA